jgi:outer membrane protein
VPQLALTASRVHSDQGYDNKMTPPYNVGTIGLQLSIPIYEGGRVQATVREATARFEIARERLDGARRQIEREVRTAYLNARTNHARIDSTNEEVRSLEMVVAERRKSYTLGASTVVDVLIAQQRLLKARSDQSRARYDYIRDLTNLRARAGTLSTKDIEEVDGWMLRPPRAQETVRS